MKTYPDPMTAEYCAGALSGGNATADEQMAAARHLSGLIEEREALRKDALRYRRLCFELDAHEFLTTQVEIDDEYCEDSEHMSRILDEAIATAAPKEAE